MTTDVLVNGSKVKATGDKCNKTILSNNLENEFLLHIFVQLIFNRLVQLYNTSVTQKTL